MEENSVHKNYEKSLKLKKMVYYILGILETVFAFRFVFKLLGANPGSPFVKLIYSISGALQVPFNGIFSTAVNKGTGIKSILEPTTIIAIIVYAIIAYGVVRLIEIHETPRKKGIF